jgi:hypothetical protein
VVRRTSKTGVVRRRFYFEPVIKPSPYTPRDQAGKYSEFGVY